MFLEGEQTLRPRPPHPQWKVSCLRKCLADTWSGAGVGCIWGAPILSKMPGLEWSPHLFLVRAQRAGCL